MVDRVPGPARVRDRGQVGPLRRDLGPVRPRLGCQESREQQAGRTDLEPQSSSNVAFDPRDRSMLSRLGLSRDRLRNFGNARESIRAATAWSGLPGRNQFEVAATALYQRDTGDQIIREPGGGVS